MFTKKLNLILAIVFIFIQCKDKNQQQNVIEIDPKFAAYISAYTSGLVSKSSNIKIVLQGEYPHPTGENGLIQEKILHFEPKINGKLYLDETQTIKFIPDEMLKAEQTYTAQLDLSKIYPKVNDSLKLFQFQFQTKKQSFAAQITALNSISKENPNIYNIEGELITNDLAATEDIQKMLSVMLDNQKVPVQWRHAGNNLEHRFIIPNIQAGSSEKTLKLTWNGKAIGVDKEEIQTYNVPQENTFSTTHIRAVSMPEQYVSVYFSEPLDNKQFLQGLVELQSSAENPNSENDSNFIQNIIADGNELRIYTSKKIGGIYNLKIFPGLRSASGKSLSAQSMQAVEFQQLFPEVKLVGNGNIIPHTDGLFLPFEAVGLNAVRVKITKIYENNIHQFFQKNQYNSKENLRMVGKTVLTKIISLDQQKNFNSLEKNVYRLELSRFIQPEPGAIYNIEFSFDQKFASFPCSSDLIQNNEFLTPLEPSADAYTLDSEFMDNEYYYYDDYYYPEGFDWNQRNNPCHLSYYTAERNVSRNILASDLGIIAKVGNNRQADISVTNLITAQGETGVDVIAYDLQNQIVGKGRTDVNGFATFALERKPFLITAQKGRSKAYVRVDDGSSLSLSNFAVDGQNMENGMAGIIYGERGVWRPGDSIHLTFVLNKSLVNIPEGQPAVLEFKNPDGQIITRQVNHEPQNGFYTFGLNTYQAARTGNWTAEVSLGGLKFYKTIKVETIKPNRLKINTKFPSELLSPEGSNSYQLQAQWLSGAQAGNLPAKIVATVSSVPTKFDAYPNYVFDDPSRKFSAQEQSIYDASLSENGTAQVATRISTDMLPPGMLQLGLFTKVFEPGGEFSTKYEIKKYSPFSTYVGMNLPTKDTAWRMLETNTQHRIPVASVDANGNPVSSKLLNAKIYKIEKSWWWNANDLDLAYYVSREYENLVEEKQLTIKDGTAVLDLEIPDDQWGNYFIRICDNQSGHCTGENVWFDWSDWRSRGGSGMDGASLLSFKADKEKYEIGDVAQITIPSSWNGNALLSIENATGILQKDWKKTEDGSTTFSIPITENMAPNAYVHITMIQPHAQTVNDLPMRMYGVIPLMVENKNRKLHPVIQAPEEVKPNAEYKINVKEQNGKPMTYTLAVVDEGLLDITNYNTPNIFGHFNQKQALGVKTWDIYNYVLGAFGGRIESVFAIGGDMSMQAQNKEKINRFEPVVKFLGPFTLEKNQSKTHQLQMENYVGSVKVMVVAGDGTAFGSAEKSMSVKQALMTLTTMPRILNPGDIVEMPVTVFAMDKKIKNVNISLKHNELLTLRDDSSKSLNFTETGDKIVNFTFEVPEKIGKANLEVQVNSNQEKAFQKIELEVRSPNAPITRSTGAEVVATSTYQTSYQPFGMEGTNSIQLQLSTIPDMRLGERLNYLLNYPHGCVEQITSSVFPQLYLADLMNLTDNQKLKIESNIKSVLQRMKNHQLTGGGLAYWPGAVRADDWSSSYALHFILKAEEKGYQIPIGLKEGLINFQVNEAKHWNYYHDNLSYANQLQTYRLYTLAMAGKPDLSSMNRLRESQLNATAKWQLISAYQLAGQGEIANKMRTGTPIQVTDYTYNPHTYGSSLRDRAIILTALNDTGQRQQAGTLMRNIATELQKDTWYSTQTTAYALMAISEFIQKSGIEKGIYAELNINGKIQEVKSNKALINIDLPVGNGGLSVKNLQNSYLYASVVNTGIPAEIQSQKEEKNLKMDINYFDLNNQPLQISSLRQGTDFVAVVHVSHPGILGAYQEISLTQIFPSGWEIINTRINNQMTSYENSGLDFQDFRDDRVYSYFDLNSGKSIKITTLLNATYAGEFDLPAAWCQAMYDNEIYALEPGKRVKVIR
ncbi:MAG: MG2 domain-containing protein [Flavobacteriaceae bacterium]|nr:MG2 domain-containing protein [Flavobacteriaceae bacterium]